MAKILIVGDSSTEFDAVVAIQRENGHQVAVASMDSEALEQLDTFCPDLVVTMLDPAGIAAILQFSRRKSQIPVLTISGA